MTDLLTPVADGQGGAPPAPAAPGPSAATTLTTAPVVAPVAAPAWLTGADEARVGYVQNKGWTDPTQVVESYVNLEKLLGADRAGRTVVLPNPDAAPAELASFYDKLGRPSDPSGYKIPVPEGVPPEFATGVAAKLHELGIPKAAGEGLAAWWNEQATAAQAANKDALDAAITADDAALKASWGAAFQQNVAVAQSAVRALGIDKATIDKMEANMGLKATMELFQKIGSKTGEPEFVTGEGGQKFGNALTPGQAQAKIAELKTDHDFIRKLSMGDAGARAELSRLSGFAYPEGS
jgi:hypothetical protein